MGIEEIFWRIGGAEVNPEPQTVVERKIRQIIENRIGLATLNHNCMVLYYSGL